MCKLVIVPVANAESTNVRANIFVMQLCLMRAYTAHNFAYRLLEVSDSSPTRTPIFSDSTRDLSSIQKCLR